jgi:uncharacterized membrane protein
MNRATLRKIVRIGLGILVGGAGLAHFVYADLFTRVVPEALHAYRGTVNVATGIVQTAMGVAFLVPRLRTVARWSTIALLVVTLPAAIDQVVHPEIVESLGLPPALAGVRVLAQLLMIALIWWATRPDDTPEDRR